MAPKENLPSILRWNVDVPYAQAAKQQEEWVEQRQEALIVCQHPPSITLGTSTGSEDLTLPAETYEQMGYTVHKSPRGGKATYHGPGQLVFYPILDLRKRKIPLHAHLLILEHTMIHLCRLYGFEAQRFEDKAGCWVGNKKIGFIGIRVRRGMVFHGCSFNITPQQHAFQGIIPCGMPDLTLTSLEEETGQSQAFWHVATQMLDIYSKCFYEISRKQEIA